MGQVCMIPEGLRCCLGQRMVMLRPDANKCDSRFLLYAIQSDSVQREILVNEGTGSTVSNIRIPLLMALPIPLPPLAEQRAVSSILGALDDKIELNRRMNETLEGIARALFQSWFVDFDPVRAKLDGRPPAGLSPAVAELFPDAFQHSEIGLLPVGWMAGTIADCCIGIQNGGTPRRDEPIFWDRGDIPWLTSGEVRQTIVTTPQNFITEAGLNASSAKWVLPLSTVVALYGATAGQVSLVSSRMTTNQAVCSLIPKQHYAYYNYLLMRSNTKELESKAVGSAQQNISKGIVEETRVILPPPPAVERFDETVGPLFDRWIANLYQSRTLATLRDTLLPKLLSGELSVRNLESQVAAMV